MKRGTTLVETAIFAAIAMVVIVTLFVVYRDTQREMVRTNAHLRGVQAAGALLERIRLDLRAATGFEAVNGQNGARADGPILELWRHQADPALAQAIPPDPPQGLAFFKLLQVRYSYDARTRRVTRQESGGKPEPLPVRYRALSFERAGALLDVKLEWVPEELLERPSAEQNEVLAVRVLFSLEGEARASQHPGRVVNSTSLFQPVPIGAPGPGGKD